MTILWSNFCIYVFVLLFSFSIFSDRRSLKIENENNNTKTKVHTAQVYKETNPGSLELPLTKTYVQVCSM